MKKLKKIPNTLIGVEMNLGANKMGSDFAPSILKNNYSECFKQMEILKVEREDEDFSKWNLKYKNTILKTCNKLAKKVNEIINIGERPIVIGGDHSIALGSISGVSAEKKVGVLWIDAHGDMNTDKSTVTGHIHGMPLAALQGLGDRDLVNCHYTGKKVDSDKVVILGARDVDKEEQILIEKNKVKIIYFDEVIKKGLDNILEEIKEYLEVDFLHISFDVDSMDPKVSPGVSTPVKGGFSADEVFKIFQFCFEKYELSSIDIVELNPYYDKENMTANFVNDLVKFILEVA